jgi:hypothetical protein
MQYEGIDYRILQTTTPNVWAWSIDLPNSMPILGKTKGSRRIADAVVRRTIDKYLRGKIFRNVRNRTDIPAVPK